MSYHLALRSLQLSVRQKGVGGFADCIDHSLAGEHSAQLLMAQIETPAVKAISGISLADAFGELLAVDVNPVGHAFRLARSETTYVKAWDFYNNQGNVISRIGYSCASGGNVAQLQAEYLSPARGGASFINSVHERMYSAYIDNFQTQVRKNHDGRVFGRRVEDSRVSAVARIFAVDPLIQELSYFFEEYPGAKVGQACQRLGIHPRLLERRMLGFGISAIKIKRACMLSQATQQILWSRRKFTDIATDCGYAHSAHLTQAISRATGGMSPSLLRNLVGA